jgi:hypothetical protein
MKMPTFAMVPIADIKPVPWNPRRNEGMVDAIVRSIERFGYTSPILVRRQTMEVVGGHVRLRAMSQLGADTVPVVLLDLDESEAKAYAIFDNKSVENAPWDYDALASLVTDLQGAEIDLSLTGFTTEELQQITGDGVNLDGFFGEGTIADALGGKAKRYRLTLTFEDGDRATVEPYVSSVGKDAICTLILDAATRKAKEELDAEVRDTDPVV